MKFKIKNFKNIKSICIIFLLVITIVVLFKPIYNENMTGKCKGKCSGKGKGFKDSTNGSPTPITNEANKKLLNNSITTRSPSHSNNTMGPDNSNGSSGKELCKNKNVPQFVHRDLHHSRLHALGNL